MSLRATRAKLGGAKQFGKTILQKRLYQWANGNHAPFHGQYSPRLNHGPSHLLQQLWPSDEVLTLPPCALAAGHAGISALDLSVLSQTVGFSAMISDDGLEVQGVQAEVTADVAEGNGAPRRSNRLRVRTLARGGGGSLEFPPTNFPVLPVLSRAHMT